MKTLKALKYLICWLFIPSLAVSENINYMTALQGTDYHLLHSEVVDHDYHIFVKVPEVENPQKLPVVYLLDGGNLFPMLTPYARYLSLGSEMSPVIMVGISYGTDDWRKGNMRSRDYTLPAKDRDHYGGAEKFQQFLAKELIPMIETKYPADPEQRILVGHSIGGQFAIYTTMFHPETFSGVIASNPALHRNVDLFLEPINHVSSSTRLFILQANQDDERFKTPRKKWLDHWRNQPKHWRQKVMSIDGHDHMSSLPAAFRQGLLWLLPEKSTKQDTP